jgi:ribosomal protein L34
VVKADLTKAEARKHAKKIREAGFLARVVAHAGPKAKRGYKVCQGHRRRRAPRKNLDI